MSAEGRGSESGTREDTGEGVGEDSESARLIADGSLAGGASSSAVAASPSASASGGAGASAALLPVSTVIALNFIASCSIVVLNKLLFQTLRFPFVTLLTAGHFLAAAGFLELGAMPQWGLFVATSPPPPAARVWRLAVAGAVSIVAMNYSLQLNALGTFQLLKAAVLPAVMALSLALRFASQVPTRLEALAAGLVVAGSCISVTADVALTPAGLAWGCAGVALTALFQMWSSADQKALGMSGIQLLHASSLPQGLLTLAAALIVETDWARHTGAVPSPAAPPRADLWTYSYPPIACGLALATCAIAIVLNWSAFAILGRTSAVTMQVTTQAKSALIIILDLIVFPRASASTAAQTAAFVLGTALCLGGALWYGLMKAGGPVPPPVGVGETQATKPASA